MKWEEIDLSIEVEKVSKKIRNFDGCELPFIGLEHIEKETLGLSGIGDVKEINSDKTVFQINDVLFGTLRPYFRKVYKAKFDGVCSTDITVLRARKNSKINQDYLFYFIANKPFVDYASSFAKDQRPRVNWKDVVVKKFKFPKPDVQRRIATILSAYDDLIENNLKRIKLLEEAARCEYRMISKNKVKYNFRKYKVDEILKPIKRKPKILNSDFKDKGEYPIIDQSTNFISGYTNEKETVYFEPLPMILFGDHTRILKFITFPFACGADGTQLIHPNDINIPVSYLYFELIDLNLSNYHYARHFKFLKERIIYLPDNNQLKDYKEKTDSNFELIQVLRLQNSRLREARDILLPRLMNGEVEV